MPDFAYRAVTDRGRILRGVEQAGSAAVLEHQLSARGLFPLEVSPRPERTNRPRFRRKRADVVEAFRYLATLVDAGFPLDRALETVSRVVARSDVMTALQQVRAQVQAGAALADALAEQPRLFPPLAVGMIRAGERGGTLAPALDRLAEHLEGEEALRSELVAAMYYPMLVAIVGGVAMLVLVLYVLPRFVDVIGEAGAAIPRTTALLLHTSALAQQWWPLLVLGVIAAVVVGVSYRRSVMGRAKTDAFLLRLPVVGPLRQRLVAARLGRSLATLLDSGMPILPALDIAARALGDSAATEQVLRARQEVQAGVRLAPALGRGHGFPYLFLQMVEVGEESGRLAEMLARAATAAEGELRRGLERLVRLVEPALIVAFGAVAGFVALSLLQAIYGFRVDLF